MVWGRATVGGAGSGGTGAVKTNGSAEGEVEQKRINVVATASVDQTIKIWTP